MLLTIDIGNTNIVLGLFKKKKLAGEWRISTYPLKTGDEFAILMEDLFSLKKIVPEESSGVILSSVVPPLTPVFVEIAKKYFNTKALTDERITPEISSGMI